VGFLLLLVEPVVSRAQTICRVIDDYGAPVKCSVVRVTSGSERVSFGETDENGGFSIRQEMCEGNPVFCFEPKGENHFRSRIYTCNGVIKNPTFTIIITKKAVLDNLKWNAKHFEERNAYATAAMIYNDIYQRALAFDNGLAEEMKRKAIDLFAGHLKNARPMVYDALRKKEVLAPGFRDDIKKFQREKGIPDTGAIDMRTLRSASGASMGQFMFRRLED
jgi:hypothetical protein